MDADSLRCTLSISNYGHNIGIAGIARHRLIPKEQTPLQQRRTTVKKETEIENLRICPTKPFKRGSQQMQQSVQEFVQKDTKKGTSLIMVTGRSA